MEIIDLKSNISKAVDLYSNFITSFTGNSDIHMSTNLTSAITQSLSVSSTIYTEDI